MTNHLAHDPIWSTAAFGAATGTTALELSSLGDHLGHCQGTGPRLLAMRYGAEATQTFITARFVTTLLMFTALIAGVVSMMS